MGKGLFYDAIFNMRGKSMKRLFVVFLCLLMVCAWFAMRKTKNAVHYSQEKIWAGAGEEGGIDWGSVRPGEGA